MRQNVKFISWRISLINLIIDIGCFLNIASQPRNQHALDSFLHAVFADTAYCVYVYWCSNNFNDTHSRIYLRSNIMFICGYLQREDICIKVNHNIHWPFQNGCWSVPGDWLLLKFWAPFERLLGWRWLIPPDGWPSLSQKLF